MISQNHILTVVSDQTPQLDWRVLAVFVAGLWTYVIINDCWARRRK